MVQKILVGKSMRSITAVKLTIPYRALNANDGIKINHIGRTIDQENTKVKKIIVEIRIMIQKGQS